MGLRLGRIIEMIVSIVMMMADIRPMQHRMLEIAR